MSAIREFLGTSYIQPQRVDIAQFIPTSTSVVWRSAHASAFQLQDYAWRRLAVVRTSGEANPTAEALGSLGAVIRTFVIADGPTPQVGATPSGSVEVQWLVAGTLVSALFDESGEYNLYAVNPNDSVLFDAEVGFGEPVPEDVRESLSKLLNEMSQAISVRPASWA